MVDNSIQEESGTNTDFGLDSSTDSLTEESGTETNFNLTDQLTQTVSFDTVIKNRLTAQTSLDLALQQQNLSESVVVDTAVTESLSKAVSTDLALKQLGSEVQLSVDTAVKNTDQKVDYSVDAAVAERFDSVTSFDAVLKSEESSTVSVDAATMIQSESEASLDTAILTERSANVSIDASIQSEGAWFVYSDGVRIGQSNDSKQGSFADEWKIDADKTTQDRARFEATQRFDEDISPSLGTSSGSFTQGCFGLHFKIEDKSVLRDSDSFRLRVGSSEDDYAEWTINRTEIADGEYDYYTFSHEDYDQINGSPDWTNADYAEIVFFEQSGNSTDTFIYVDHLTVSELTQIGANGVGDRRYPEEEVRTA